MTKKRRNLPSTLRVIVLAPPRGQLVGIIGLLEALDAANRLRAARGRPPPYAVELVGLTAATPSAAGPVLRTPRASTIDRLHTLVVGGGLEMADRTDARVLAETGRLAALGERIVSVCVGAFALGELGLLDGRRCTTHWIALDRLRQRFPAARVEDDAIYTEDGPIFTSAGASAGIDLALHLIRRDCGPALALAVARSLVVFAQRPGGQSQFGAALRLRPGLDDRLHALVAAILREPAGDHDVESLARRSGMSPRHFARVFREQTGETPAAFVTRVRVEAAQRLLAGSDAPIAQVADDVGYGSVDAFRRSFERVAGVQPSAWRSRFQAEAG
ncbi:MAG: helix-turn-helix domain-containing protein [Nannocystaceae bacterium]